MLVLVLRQLISDIIAFDKLTLKRDDNLCVGASAEMFCIYDYISFTFTHNILMVWILHKFAISQFSPYYIKCI